MNDETKKLIQEQYSKLPKQLQDAIQSAHLHETITSIATANKLHIDQIGEFENEVMMLMMGFTDPIEFVGELQKTLTLSAEAALKIATETNIEILLPIRERMENATSDVAPTAPAPSNAPAVNMPPATSEKSVVMPSAAKVPAPVVAPAATPAAVTPVVPATPAPAPTMQTVPAMVKPAGLPMVPHVDAMLDAPTVSIAPKPATPVAPTVPAAAATSPATPSASNAKVEPPKPGPIYKTDPYHEPID